MSEVDAERFRRMFGQLVAIIASAPEVAARYVDGGTKAAEDHANRRR